ncbi:Fe3+ hydroxamate ABC transporter substrate-binding protein [Planococcus maritimus]|uniref:Fe3+ hydroxamate ABC transporter substrate-binding protein n=1 Tax=Planococcus maritimus TaxID=192421 RepID=UPI00080F2CCF|nr:Fe3+ hydroxamate ABC transporter substrate-binding protein [Planococcus maritimus]ANU15654.1 Fe3+ hydroxamate ABC transporter substrate-binding protein [Planococcus maritimus]
MFNESSKCRVCGKEIEGGEPVHLEMRYPKRRGFTEIKAYLKLEARFTCDACANNKT